MNQETALGILLSGKNAFITGAAGAGKTYLLNEFMRRSKRANKRVARTASTGIAATLLDGNTVHSWSGVGIRDKLSPWFFEKLSKTRQNTIRRADILVIDEISMLKDWYLDLVNQVCKVVRGSSKPFGGLQVVLSGDFAQLPPVNSGRDRDGQFAYYSKAWQELEPVICYLDTQFRQEDQDFVDILNAIRIGDYRRHHVAKLLDRKNAELPEHRTELYTTNYNVDRINHRRLQDISAREHYYAAEFSGSRHHIANLKKSVLAPETLILKKGATVMALKNDPSGRYVNGSVGEVLGFGSFSGNPVVRFNNGKTVTMEPVDWDRRDDNRKLASMTQIPLKLAWAITIHKSQGMTLDAARIDLLRAFAPGMGYVALSRVKSLSSLSLVGLSKSALIVSDEAIKMNRQWAEEAKKYASKYKHLATPLKEKAQNRNAKKSDRAKKSPVIHLTDDEKASKKAEKEARSKAWAEKLANMRKTYPKAFMEWTLKDDFELQKLFIGGKTIPEIVDATGRHPGSIRARLKKNYGKETFADGFPN